jgi:hypothetical protein
LRKREREKERKREREKEIIWFTGSDKAKNRKIKIQKTEDRKKEERQI